jgi:hypothetical protein
MRRWLAASSGGSASTVSLAVGLFELAVDPDRVLTLFSSVDVINLVLFVFDIGRREAGVDILRSLLMLRCILSGDARYICIFKRTILIKSTTNEICTIWKLGSTRTDLHRKTFGSPPFGRLHVIQWVDRRSRRSTMDRSSVDTCLSMMMGLTSKSPECEIAIAVTLVVRFCKSSLIVGLVSIGAFIEANNAIFDLVFLILVLLVKVILVRVVDILILTILFVF